MIQQLHQVVADIPAGGGYISLVKWVVFLLGAAGWLALCQWVDKDTWRLHYRRYTFNGVLVASGVLGLILWLLIPVFALGLLFYAVLVGTAGGVYTYLRNQLVPEVSRVLTAQHFSRLFGRAGRADAVAPPTVELQTLAHQSVPGLSQSDPLFDGYQAGQALLAGAIDRRAGLVSLAPSAHGLSVQYTIDGLLVDGGTADRGTAESVIAYFKKIGGLDTNERRRPQTGQLIATLPAQPIDPQLALFGYNVPESLPARSLSVEIHTSGSRAGETLRLTLADVAGAPTLDTLGLSDRQLELLSEFRRSHGGGVVLLGCGGGTGATTTFYQMLRAHDAFMSNIQTLEEQPETDLENITQHAHQAEASTDATFGRQLQSIIRRGPDVVGVSQCKDRETAQLIARSAAENIKFYVEMAARDSFTLLARWVALVGDLSLAMQPIRLVFTQTLIRTLCTGCREAYRPDPALLRKINLPADRIERLYRPPTRVPTDKQGNKIACPLCQGGGYVGRTGVFEMLVVDDELRRLVVANASANEIKKYCRTQKMLYLQEEALRKVIAGQTSVNEVVRIFQEGK